MKRDYCKTCLVLSTNQEGNPRNSSSAFLENCRLVFCEAFSESRTSMPFFRFVLQDTVHLCELICGKKLRCKLHKCEELCHPGYCPPCLLSGKCEELFHPGYCPPCLLSGKCEELCHPGYCPPCLLSGKECGLRDHSRLWFD